jgi:hypothetical protein
LENFSTATPEELDQQWAEFLKERSAANELRKEIEAALSGGLSKKEGQQ